MAAMATTRINDLEPGMVYPDHFENNDVTRYIDPYMLEKIGRAYGVPVRSVVRQGWAHIIEFMNGFRIACPEGADIIRIVEHYGMENRYRYEGRFQYGYKPWDADSKEEMMRHMAKQMAYEEPEPPCKSCGKVHNSKLDFLGRCDNTLKKFWEKVRKLYWHRYAKTKTLKQNCV